MIPTLAPEDIDNMLIYERSTERRSGIERRTDDRMKNTNFHHAAVQDDEHQPSTEINYVNDFG